MTVVDIASATLKWQHPTGKLPKKVLIAGLGPSKGDLLEATSGHVPLDLVMGSDEVWGVNAAVNQYAGRIAYDMVFMMDYLEGEVRRYPKYIQHTENYLRRFPNSQLLTSQAGSYKGLLPNLHEYPIHWVILRNGRKDLLYYHNSIPYMIAYGLAIGVEQFNIWGCDYSHERFKHREDDRANAEFWIGVARARGVQVWIPDTSSLCSTDRHLWFYGYHDQPEYIDKLFESNAKAELLPPGEDNTTQALPVTTLEDESLMALDEMQIAQGQ